MKKSKLIKIIISVVIILFISIILLVFILNKKSYDIPKEYQKIRYQEVENNITKYACITFSKNGSYSMYDCDSEPTNYFFDNENECTYKFYESKNIIKFICKYDIQGTNQNKIKNVYFDEDMFSFELNNEKKIFYSKEWIEKNLEEE